MCSYEIKDKIFIEIFDKTQKKYGVLNTKVRN